MPMTLQQAARPLFAVCCAMSTLLASHSWATSTDAAPGKSSSEKSPASKGAAVSSPVVSSPVEKPQAATSAPAPAAKSANPVNSANPAIPAIPAKSASPGSEGKTAVRVENTSGKPDARPKGDAKAQIEEEPRSRGLKRTVAPRRKEYRKRWAVIVGINYHDADLSPDARKFVPALRNAENDARGVADVLIKHYGYTSETLKLLIGKQATQKAIRAALSSDFLGKESEVGPDDSVLFFFAGHGFRRGAKEQHTGELLPWDVECAIEGPKSHCGVQMGSDVVRLLELSPARHKLIVLDCCHSGEVLTLARQAAARSESLRYDSGTFDAPSFQAIASSRNVELASDGKDGHSAFTAAMLSGLKVLPRQQGVEVPITANDLFIQMVSELRSAPRHEQSPACRWLTQDQGEFHFFPQGDFSTYSRADNDEMMMAVAMSPGTYGAWWFDEMPWFIPSLRSEILKRVEKKRGDAQTDWVEKVQLRRSAYEVRRMLANDPSELAKLRLKHLSLLLDPRNFQEGMDVYATISKDLQQPPAGVELDASDWHLLAVLEQKLGKRSNSTYENALRAYGKLPATDPRAPLRLLCLADQGESRLAEGDFQRAARSFQRALEHRVLCPLPFQAYALCREAAAWQGLGRWGEADVKLSLALKIADQQKISALTAFVWTRRAWAYMEQWRFAQAAEAFQNANALLPKDLLDREALIIHFHNRHGLAMARRFTGDPQGALADYRRISNELRKLFGQLRSSTGTERNFSEIRERIAGRLLNTLERQADCNLFRENGDLKEAGDDLRRALRVAEACSKSGQGAIVAGLLYKQALAYSRRSPYQDIEVATEVLREADSVLATLSDDQQTRLNFHKVLATAMVKMQTEMYIAEDEAGGADAKREGKKKALVGLRAALEDLRPRLNRPVQRDHLELLLFAAQALLQEDMELADRYQIMKDSERLLELCRQVRRSQKLVTQRYLRHYYDTAIAGLMAARPSHVQGVLEAVHEATTGESYDKPGYPVPTLVFYHAEGRFRAVLDVPNGVSKWYLLDEGISLEAVRDAERTQRSLSLPRDLTRDLADVTPRIETIRMQSVADLAKPRSSSNATEGEVSTRGEGHPERGTDEEPEEGPRALVVRWMDPYYNLGTATQSPVRVLASTSVETPRGAASLPVTAPVGFVPKEPVIRSFPFTIPIHQPHQGKSLPMRAVMNR